DALVLVMAISAPRADTAPGPQSHQIVNADWKGTVELIRLGHAGDIATPVNAQAYVPANGADLAHDAAQKCGFAGTIRAHDGCHGPALKHAGHIAHGKPVAPAQIKLVQLNGRRGIRGVHGAYHQPIAQLVSAHIRMTTVSTRSM